MKIALALIMVIVANVAMAATAANQLSAVDPLIGTGQTVDGVASCEKGATMPYVGVPFGSVMWVPMTRESQFGTLAFNQQDTKLLGFAASRQMAVAMGEWGEFSFLPTMGTGTPSTVFAKRGQTISAKSFTPYSGSVSAGGIKTDYTATAHAAIYKITFPGHVTRQPQIVFDASRDDMFRRFPDTAAVQPGGSRSRTVARRWSPGTPTTPTGTGRSRCPATGRGSAWSSRRSPWASQPTGTSSPGTAPIP